jgi:hypothetical protein
VPSHRRTGTRDIFRKAFVPNMDGLGLIALLPRFSVA